MLFTFVLLFFLLCAIEAAILAYVSEFCTERQIIICFLLLFPVGVILLLGEWVYLAIEMYYMEYLVNKAEKHHQEFIEYWEGKSND